MKKTVSHCLAAAVLAAAALHAVTPAMADSAVACGSYRPGLLAWLAGTAVRPATCVYQGDYIAHQGPTYDGPAVIAPQPTYSPSRSVAGYVHGPYRAPAVRAKPVVRRATVKRVKRTVVKKSVVNVKSELPPSKGKAKIIRARAEVRIYGPDRMDIRLYRR